MVDPATVTWLATKSAKAVFESVWKNLPHDDFLSSRDALRQMLCQYFGSDSGDDCSKGINKSIAPLGGCGPGRKLLKVRWHIPGGGKSAGLRIALVVDCAKRKVWLAGAWPKKVEPSDSDFQQAAATVPADS